MYTYQDLLANSENDSTKAKFVMSAINSHKASDDYKTAWIAEQYNRHRNVTIVNYQKLLYEVSGKAVPDNFSANYKMACRHFHRFIVQEVQFLLGNGVTWDDNVDFGNKKKPFDTQLQILGRNALIHKVAFGYWNVDHIEAFNFLEFAPLFDEENGALRAGIRFWQMAENKPLTATLYEEDGYTVYRFAMGKEPEIIKDKTPYVLKVKSSVIDGTWIEPGENYPSLPIIPLWGNSEKQSEIVGLREQIDCYDLIKSGFANTVDEASFVYWTINNANGMDEVDLAQFIDRMRTVHAAVVDEDGAKAESHQQDAPFESREALLNRLDKDMYRDAMALDVERIASGSATATEIRAAYEPLNAKCDDFEYCIREFISSLCDLTGIEANPSFTRSTVVNRQEDITSLITASTYLKSDYITRKVLELLGDGDLADEMIKQMDADELDRFGNLDNQDEDINKDGEIDGEGNGQNN